MGTLTQLLDDPACAGNTTLQLITGMVYAHDNNHIEALRCCHQASTLEMYGAATCSMLCVVPCELFMFATLCECGKSHRMALAVQVLLAMNRPDQAEKQVKVPVGGSNNTLLKQGLMAVSHTWHNAQAMSSMDDDATITQLATAWVNMALVRHWLVFPR